MVYLPTDPSQEFDPGDGLNELNERKAQEESSAGTASAQTLWRIHEAHEALNNSEEAEKALSGASWAIQLEMAKLEDEKELMEAERLFEKIQKKQELLVKRRRSLLRRQIRHLFNFASFDENSPYLLNRNQYQRACQLLLEMSAFDQQLEGIRSGETILRLAHIQAIFGEFDAGEELMNKGLHWVEQAYRGIQEKLEKSPGLNGVRTFLDRELENLTALYEFFQNGFPQNEEGAQTLLRLAEKNFSLAHQYHEQYQGEDVLAGQLQYLGKVQLDMVVAYLRLRRTPQELTYLECELEQEIQEKGYLSIPFNERTAIYSDLAARTEALAGLIRVKSKKAHKLADVMEDFRCRLTLNSELNSEKIPLIALQYCDKLAAGKSKPEYRQATGVVYAFTLILMMALDVEMACRYLEPPVELPDWPEYEQSAAKGAYDIKNLNIRAVRRACFSLKSSRNRKFIEQNLKIFEEYLRLAWSILSREKYPAAQEFPEKLAEHLRQGDLEAFLDELDLF